MDSKLFAIMGDWQGLNDKGQKEHERLLKMKEDEERLRGMGLSLVCGVDEAGRGCLFGPVVAACAIMPQNSLIYGVNDSKKLSAKQRGDLYESIAKNAVSFAIGVADNFEIDRLNILNASKLAMRRAFEALETKADGVLSDAVHFQSKVYEEAIIKGDSKSYSIAAASIIAKTTRDKMMLVYDKIYPGYSFSNNKGYATLDHREALASLGPTALHRFSFLSNALPEAPLYLYASQHLIRGGYKVDHIEGGAFVAFGNGRRKEFSLAEAAELMKADQTAPKQLSFI